MLSSDGVCDVNCAAAATTIISCLLRDAEVAVIRSVNSSSQH